MASNQLTRIFANCERPVDNGKGYRMKILIFNTKTSNIPLSFYPRIPILLLIQATTIYRFNYFQMHHTLIKPTKRTQQVLLLYITKQLDRMNRLMNRFMPTIRNHYYKFFKCDLKQRSNHNKIKYPLSYLPGDSNISSCGMSSST